MIPGALRYLILISTIAMLPVAAAPPQPTPAQQVAALKADQKIKVTLLGGETLKGRLGPVTANSFTLAPSDAKASPRDLGFDEVQSVRRDGLTRLQKWAIAGGVWGALTLIGSFL